MKVYKAKSYNYVTIVEIDNSEIEQIRLDVCNQPRETLETYYKRQGVKPTVLVNGGLFNMSTGNPCGTLVVDSKTYASSSKYRTGMGTAKGDATKLVYDLYDNRRWTDFVNGYPVLIVNGVAQVISYAKELNYKTRRTVVGYSDTKHFIVCVESPGMIYSQLQALCLSLGMKYAINLDGGGSTRLLVNGVRKTTLATNRAVDNVLAIYLKEQSQEVDRWVQVVMSKINIRSGPGADYALNGSMKKGDKAHIIATADGSPGSAPIWGKLEDGRGWIPIDGSYTKDVNAASNEYVGRVTASALNVRYGPGTNYQIVGSKRYNSVVTVSATSNGWGKIGNNQWVSLAYIKKI